MSQRSTTHLTTGARLSDLLRISLVLLLPPAAWAQPPLLNAEVDGSLRAIQQLGGHAYRTSQGWHVDFHVHGQAVQDADLSHVLKLKNVSSLNLNGTKISDEGLRQIGKLASLERLYLDRTAITDDGVQRLTELAQLRYLNVCRTRITDMSIASLSELKGLKQLYLWRTAITADGAKAIAHNLPGATIERGVQLSRLPPGLTPPAAPSKPRVAIAWKPIQRRADAAAKSESGLNVDLYLDNKRDAAVKLFWISYEGALQPYGEVPAGGARKQNTYGNNAWLITDLKDQPLGWFMMKQSDGVVVIPAE